MKSSPSSTEDKNKELGRVIAQATHEENVRREKNMASAVKRKETMLRNAAEKAFGQFR